MWRAGTPDPACIRRLTKVRERHDLTPLVIHDNYLINLASVDPILRPQSIAAFRAELQRGIAIEADYLVMHPGNYKGHTLEQGILAIAVALGEAAKGLHPGKLQILLENTAGQGASIGCCFEELAAIRNHAQDVCAFPIGYCIDTAHCLASGRYDLSSEQGLRDTVRQATAILGLENIPVFHVNDSKTPLGSHVDRHQNIGEGYIGIDGFRRLLTHPKLRSKAFILETPVENEGDDRRNLDTLKSLCRKSNTTISKSS